MLLERQRILLRKVKSLKNNLLTTNKINKVQIIRLENNDLQND